MIFVNLPVADLPRAMAFWQALGFAHNPAFSDETAACIVISDTIFLMLLTHPKFDGFARRPRPDPQATTGALIALSCDSRAEVDAMAGAALAAGGAEARPAEDLGFMYTRPFADPEGHVFEPFWFDPAAIPTG